VLADTGYEYSAISRSAVMDTRKCEFLLQVKVLPEPIMLNMGIRGENNKDKFRATEMLMSAMTITTPLCLRGVRQIIAEEEIDHLLIGRPVLDEMGLVASQHMDSVLEKFHPRYFSHIG
jgi:hypothetical protein